MTINNRMLRTAFLSWGAATAASSGLAFTIAANAADRGVVEDIQVGERGNRTRIAVFCTTPCALSDAGGDSLALTGASTSLSVELGDRSKNILAVDAKPTDTGAIFDLKPRGDIARVAFSECVVGGRTAACVDIYHAETTAASTQASTASSGSAVAAIPAGAPRLKSQAPQLASNEVVEVETTALPQANTQDAKQVLAVPALREAPFERFAQFSRFSPPVRLEVPTQPILAKLQPIEDPVKIGKPALRQERPIVALAEVDFSQRAVSILGKSLNSVHCNNAEATLQNDAWALGAMVDLGFCTASRGDWVDGDAIFSRILEYTPDNYEALVGRALIAEHAGDDGQARKFYQDALNALPPIIESQRIVDAMSSL